MDQLQNLAGFFTPSIICQESCGAWGPLLGSAGSSHHPYAAITDQCQPLSLGVQGKDELSLSIEISCMFTELLSFLEGIY